LIEIRALISPEIKEDFSINKKTGKFYPSCFVIKLVTADAPLFTYKINDLFDTCSGPLRYRFAVSRTSTEEVPKRSRRKYVKNEQGQAFLQLLQWQREKLYS
jgi:hypothetical protein